MLGTSKSQHQRQREEGPTGPPLPPRSHLPELLGRWSGKIIPRPQKALTQKKKTPRMSVMKEALSRGYDPEAEKLPGASESTGGLAKMQIPGPHSRALIL